jgi:hypothetical protein
MNFIELNERLAYHADETDPIYSKWENSGLLHGLEENEYQSKRELAQIYENAVRFVVAETAEHFVSEELVSIYLPIIRRLYTGKNCRDYRRIWTSLLAYIAAHKDTMQDILLGGGDAEQWACSEFCNEYEEYGKMFSGKIENLEL